MVNKEEIMCGVGYVLGSLLSSEKLLKNMWPGTQEIEDDADLPVFLVGNVGRRT